MVPIQVKNTHIKIIIKVKELTDTLCLSYIKALSEYMKNAATRNLKVTAVFNTNLTTK